MIAVTGASGRLGRRVVQLLLERAPASRIIALSRTPQRVADLGVTARAADFDDPAGLVAAFDGVERALLVSTNVFGQPGLRIRQHRTAIEAAVKAGVGHVYYTSIAQAGDPAHPAAVAADHRATEAALAESGVPYTVLRHSPYADLILAGAPVALATGVLMDNSGDGAVSFVTREDCATVAATALAGGGYEGATLEVTGPHAVTQTDIADLLTELTGLPVRYQPLSDAETVADLVRHGMPEPVAREFATIGRATREGFTRELSDAVRQVTGRAPTSVADFLAANRQALTTA